VKASRKVRPDPLLVFIHIPKTAGTTIRSIIRTNNPGQLSDKPLANVFQGGGGGVHTEGLHRLREDPTFVDLDGLKAFYGHYPLGIGRYLEPAFPRRDFRYFTMLKEPVERALSHYYGLIKRLSAQARAQGDEAEDDESEDVEPLPPLPTDASFEEAIAAGYLHDNLQTRMLCGDPEPFGEVTHDMLERAKRNVREKFVLVGISERVDESLVLAKQRLMLRTMFYREGRRVNTGRPRGDAVPKETRRAAERHNRHDIELYRVVLEQFEAAPERDGLEFHVDLAALKAAKAGGEIPDDAVPPPLFEGTDDEWRMLVGARARLLWLQFRLSGPKQIQARLRKQAAGEAAARGEAARPPRPRSERPRKRPGPVGAAGVD